MCVYVCMYVCMCQNTCCVCTYSIRYAELHSAVSLLTREHLLTCMLCVLCVC